MSKVSLKIVLFILSFCVFIGNTFAAPVLIFSPIYVFAIEQLFLFLIISFGILLSIFFLFKKNILYISGVFFILSLISYFIFYIKNGYVFFIYEFLITSLIGITFYLSRNKKNILIGLFFLNFLIFSYLNFFIIFEFRVNSFYQNIKNNLDNQNIYTYYSYLDKNYYRINFYDKKDNKIFILGISLFPLKDGNHKLIKNNYLFNLYQISPKTEDISTEFNNKILNYIK